MKVFCDLENESLEIIESKPFIQGEDARNVLEVYIRSTSDPINMRACYVLPNGRTSLPMANNGYYSEAGEYKDITCDIILFKPSLALTKMHGNITITLLVRTDALELDVEEENEETSEEDNVLKFNVLNNILQAAEFESVEEGLNDYAQDILDSVNAVDERVDLLEASDTRQNQRITDLENGAGSETTNIENLNTEVFGTSTGQITPTGLKSRVGTLETKVGTLEEDNTSNKNRLDDLEEDNTTNKADIVDLKAKDIDLQSQIDSINAAQNLADIVTDLTALGNLDTSKLQVGDKVQVLVDSNHDNASTVYNWNGTTFVYIGRYGQDGYTKAETDNLLDGLQDQIDDINDDIDNLDNTKANSLDVYNKTETYNKTEVDNMINSLVVEGYEMPYEDMVAIFNDAYSDDPVVTLLNELNGEVV